MLQSILKQYSYVFFRYYGIIIAAFTGIAFGALTEYLQFVLDINRSGNIYDFIANAVGCLFGIIVFLIAGRKKIEKSKGQLKKT